MTMAAIYLSDEVVLALQKWTTSDASFDWNELLQSQHEAWQQCKSGRDAAVQRRKGLADQTKSLRKVVKQVTDGNTNNNNAAATELAKECKTTVKAYQEEIDLLVKRSKTAETHWSALLGQLAEMPNPTPLLIALQQELQKAQAEAMNNSSAASIQSPPPSNNYINNNNNNNASSLDNSERHELAQLRREIAEYEVEFKSLKNQDITIRKLEGKIMELQDSAAEQLEAELHKLQADLQEQSSSALLQAQDRQAVLQRKVDSLQVQLQAERAGTQAAQGYLLQAADGVSQREAAWEAQRQILTLEAEHLREALHTVTREKDDLQMRVNATRESSSISISSGNHNNSMNTGDMGDNQGASNMSQGMDHKAEKQAYEAEISELVETATMLRDELRSKEEAMAKEQLSNKAKIEVLEFETQTFRQQVQSLEQQLESAPSVESVESMRRELRILKRLEYNADDVDHDRDPEIARGGGINEQQDLEAVLMAKLRRAENELVTERVNRAELRQEMEELRTQLTQAEMAKDQAEKLTISLEYDLEKAIASTSLASPKHKNEKKFVATVTENPATLQSIMDPSAPVPPPPLVVDTPSKSAEERAQDDHSVATIVMAQRDRLRARCEALEAERDSFKRELQAQVSASESLKTDNTKLYEKVRYLQSFSKNNSSSSRQRSNMYNRMGSGGGDRDLDLEALEQRYEASVDPFRQFSKAERQRKLQEMSPIERLVFVVAKTVLGTKEMRTVLVFYVVSLHMLVFITTYHWSHSEGCSQMNNEHLSHLPPIIPAELKDAMTKD